jgi:uncharacterized BrkB/YihY/UPF0761 family membrane protein
MAQLRNVLSTCWEQVKCPSAMPIRSVSVCWLLQVTVYVESTLSPLVLLVQKLMCHVIGCIGAYWAAWTWCSSFIASTDWPHDHDEAAGTWTLHSLGWVVLCIVPCQQSLLLGSSYPQVLVDMENVVKKRDFEIEIFWNLMLCNLVNGYQHFVLSCCLCL